MGVLRFVISTKPQVEGVGQEVTGLEGHDDLFLDPGRDLGKGRVAFPTPVSCTDR